MVACAIVGLLSGGIFGYMMGTYITLKAVVEVASQFIDIDYQMVEQAIGQYSSHIGKCYG